MFLSRTKEAKAVRIDQGNLKVPYQVSVFYSSVGPDRSIAPWGQRTDSKANAFCW